MEVSTEAQVRCVCPQCGWKFMTEFQITIPVELEELKAKLDEQVELDDLRGM